MVTDKGIFCFGRIVPGGAKSAVSNLVSNVGVVATDVTGVGTARSAVSEHVNMAADKGIFAYGNGGKCYKCE